MVHGIIFTGTRSVCTTYLPIFIDKHEGKTKSVVINFCIIRKQEKTKSVRKESDFGEDE
jgi:hypothetical protein